jgi:hypothetical protein
MRRASHGIAVRRMHTCWADLPSDLTKMGWIDMLRRISTLAVRRLTN